MAANAIAGLLVAVFALWIGVAQHGDTFNKGYAFVLVGWAAAAYLFSVVATSGSVMANGDKEDAATWEGFGQKARIPTKAITGTNLLIVGMFTVILVMQWKILESISEQTYVLSLPQVEREKLNLAMPESLRKKIRP